jgi:hypothetical protein
MHILRLTLNTLVLLGVFIFVVSSVQNYHQKVASLESQSAVVGAPLPVGTVDTANIEVGKVTKGTPTVKKFCVRDEDQNGICIPAKGKLTYYSPTGTTLTCEWDIADPKQNSCINSVDVRSSIAHGGASFTPEGTTLSLPIPSALGNPDILDAFSGTIPENKPYESTTNTLPAETLTPQKAVFMGGSPTALRPDSTNGITNAEGNDTIGGRSQAIFDEQNPEVTLIADKKTSTSALPADAKQEDITAFIKQNRIPVDNTQESTNAWLSKVWPKDVPVLFLMELHDDRNPKQELLRVLDSGEVTHLKLEAFSLKGDRQLLINYMTGMMSREEMVDALSGRSSWYPGYASDVVDILDKAKEKGVDVQALETQSMSRLVYGLYSGDLISPQEIIRRNSNWANGIQEILSLDPNARVVVWGGSGHVGYLEGTVNQLLAKVGIPSVVVTVANTEMLNSPVLDPNVQKSFSNPFLDTQTRSNFLSAVVELGLGNEKFLTKIGSGQNGVYPADYFLHMPYQKIPSESSTTAWWRRIRTFGNGLIYPFTTFLGEAFLPTPAY